MKNPLLNLNFLFSTALTWIVTDTRAAASQACTLIEAALPGKVFYPGTETYAEDIAHWLSSSEQNAICAVNPSSVDDISTIISRSLPLKEAIILNTFQIKIIGRNDIRAAFAIKSAGHATNQGFSSTTGVQISMANFKSEVIYNEASGTVSFGSGYTWDQIYASLEPYNITVAGRREGGIGVGLILGGGYSWIADQYGLGVDNVVSYDLVMPNGTFVKVSDANHPEVLFGLRGGLNNFGIITGATMYARPLGKVWGGVITYTPSELLSKALANFSLYNTDRKAQLAASYSQISAGQAVCQVAIFYDEGFQPAVYQPFLDIPALAINISVHTFSDLLVTVGSASLKSGGFANMVPIAKYTLPIVNEIQRQINITYKQALKDKRSVIAVIVVVEPFYGAFDFEMPSAYPHSPNRQITPSSPFITFTDLADAAYFRDLLWKMSNAIQAFAVSQGQSRWDDIHYPNYALDGTPEQLLFRSNIPRLKRIKQAVDPKNVMGLTGGFKI